MSTHREEDRRRSRDEQRSRDAQRKQISAGATAPMVALEAYTRARVSRSDSHLIRLRVSAVNSCRYCTAMHRRDARKDGWDTARVRAAEDWTTNADDPAADARGMGAGERTVLRFADAVTHIDGEESVPDELWDDIVRHRGASGGGQLLMEVVTINAWNRIAIATRKDPWTLRGVEPSDVEPLRPEG